MFNFKNSFFFAILCSCVPLLCEWITPEPTAVLFAPGIFSNERQIVKYCKEYVSSNGTTYFCDNDFVVIKPPYHSINFPEIIVDTQEPRSNQNLSYFAQAYNYITNKIWHIRSKSNDTKEHIIASDTTKVQWINVRAINFGQEADIAAFSKTYDQMIERYPDHALILYGVSRGAATILNFLATEYHHKNHQHVKAVICEGCYDSIEQVIKRFSFPRLAQSIITTVFTGYDPKGISPIQYAYKIPRDIPILFITSQQDSLVPAACTQTLFNELTWHHANVDLLTLKHSAHPRYMIDNEDDKKLYESTVHGFYKKNNLPYHDQRIELSFDNQQVDPVL